MICRDSPQMTSFLVTAIGLPFTLSAFLHEQRRERDNEEQDFFNPLPAVLCGEDPAFQSHIRTVAQEERPQGMISP